jgi:hypothetical protein
LLDGVVTVVGVAIALLAGLAPLAALPFWHPSASLSRTTPPSLAVAVAVAVAARPKLVPCPATWAKIRLHLFQPVVVAAAANQTSRTTRWAVLAALVLLLAVSASLRAELVAQERQVPLAVAALTGLSLTVDAPRIARVQLAAMGVFGVRLVPLASPEIGF